MVVLEVDRVRITIAELEGNAPGSVDVDRVTRRVEAAKRMKIVSGQVQLINRGRRIESVQAGEDTLVQSHIDP